MRGVPLRLWKPQVGSVAEAKWIAEKAEAEVEGLKPYEIQEWVVRAAMGSLRSWVGWLQKGVAYRDRVFVARSEWRGGGEVRVWSVAGLGLGESGHAAGEREVVVEVPAFVRPVYGTLSSVVVGGWAREVLRSWGRET